VDPYGAANLGIRAFQFQDPIQTATDNPTPLIVPEPGPGRSIMAENDSAASSPGEFRKTFLIKCQRLPSFIPHRDASAKGAVQEHAFERKGQVAGFSASTIEFAAIRLKEDGTLERKRKRSSHVGPA